MAETSRNHCLHYWKLLNYCVSILFIIVVDGFEIKPRILRAIRSTLALHLCRLDIRKEVPPLSFISRATPVQCGFENTAFVH